MDTKKLRQKILDLAIHGKLVPQDPNDEPASVLLERIRAEKEALIKEGKIKRAKKTTTSDTPHYENVPFEVPDGWCWCRLDSICTKIVDGDHNPPSGLSTPSNYKMLSSKNVNFDSIVDVEDCRYLTHDDWTICNTRTNLQKGDILLTTVATLGRSCVVETTEQFCFQRSVTILTTLIFNKYLKYVFDSDFYQGIMSDGAKGTAQKGFYLNQVEQSFIPIPPMAEQKQIVKEIENWLSIIDFVEKEKNVLIDVISAAKSKTLDLAIHGKLVPQDSTDEPASELLKRINPKAIITGDNPHYEQVPFDIPDSWAWVKLEDINVFKSKSVNPFDNPTETYELYSVPTFETGEPEFPLGKDIASSKVVVSDGDVLLCKINPHLNRVWVVRQRKPQLKTLASSEWIVIRVNEMLPEYLELAMRSPYFRELMQRNVSGVGGSLMRAQPTFVKQYMVPVPPIQEQTRIVKRIQETFHMLDSIGESLS